MAKLKTKTEAPRLKIKTESLPMRCEICHQADCFDADLNHCSRCVGMTFHINGSLSPLNQTFFKITAGTMYTTSMDVAKLGIKTGIIIAFLPVLSLIFSPATSDAAIVVAVLAIIGGPLCGMLFGAVFSLIAVVFNLLEQLRRRNERSNEPIVNI